MKNIMKCVAAAAMLAVTAGAAQAQTVTYTTQFSCNGSSFSTPPLSTITCSYANGATLTFTGQPVTTVTAPSFIDFGTVQAGAGTNVSDLSGQQVFLQILQTSPTAGTATVAGALSGAIFSNTQSSAIINWNQPSRFATIGATTYEVERLSAGQTSINAPSTGPQTIRGFVSTTATPEPASLVLLGTGLLGVFGAATRRKKISA